VRHSSFQARSVRRELTDGVFVGQTEPLSQFVPYPYLIVFTDFFSVLIERLLLIAELVLSTR